MMTENEQLSCPLCCEVSAMASWSCDAVEGNCVCPKCGGVSDGRDVFGEYVAHHPQSVYRALPLPGEMPLPEASPINEW